MLSVVNLSCKFPVRKGILKRTIGYVHALNNVSFNLVPGETLGIVGESGCGKSTLAKSLFNLVPYSRGLIKLNEKIIRKGNYSVSNQIYQYAQLIFQDPSESLNPRHTIYQLLVEPFKIHNLGTNGSRIKTIESLLDSVGLPKGILDRFPHQFSGGQKQRIGIARALALSPDYLICDEPVSALDVSVQAQILNLLLKIQSERSLGLLVISHDLGVVRHISHKIGVMYMGELIESGTAEEIFNNHQHPYTKALIDSIPKPLGNTKKRNRRLLKGEVPSLLNLPSGCSFASRCPQVMPDCISKKPVNQKLTMTHGVVCHLVQR